MRVADVSPALRQRLGADGTNGLLDCFDRAQHEWTERVMTIAVDRFERRLAEEMGTMRTTVAEQGAAIRAEVSKSRAEIVRWLFLFWTGQVVALAALVSALR